MALPTIKYFGRNDKNKNGRPDRPGFPCRLRLELNRPVSSQDNSGQPLKVFIEYQRLVRGAGGFFMEVKAIGNAGTTYFTDADPDNPAFRDPPKALEIPVGQ